MWKKYFILCVLISNFLLTHQDEGQRESRKLLIVKLIESLGLGLGSNPLPVDKLSVALNQITKTQICQSENIQNPFITALPGQDISSGPCRVFCKEERGSGLLGVQNVRYFIALVPNTTPCLIGDTITALGICTAGVCIAAVVGTGTGVVAGDTATGVAALSPNNRANPSPKIQSTKH